MYKNIMKRTVSLLLAFSFILSMFPMTVLAEETDTRTVITEIEATTNITAPENGATIGTISKEITKGAPAYIDWIRWEKKTGYTWTFIYDANEKFTPGVWKINAHIRIDGNAGKEYKFDKNNKPTVKIDGKEWTLDNVIVEPEYCYTNAESEEYVVSEDTNTTYTIGINAVDKADSEALENAKISLLKNNSAIDSWTSTTSVHQISGLESGEYILKVTEAPEGYLIPSDVTFTVASGGTITTTGNTTTDESGNTTFIIEFEKTKVEVKVVKESDNQSLSGATIQVLDSESNVREEWTSTTENHVIEGLITGKEYTLKVTNVPNGYEIPEVSTFTIATDGKVTSTGGSTTEGILLVSISEAIPISYMVTFNTNGGSAIDSQPVNSGEKVEKPADPTRSKYKFLGWFADSEKTKSFDFENTTINEDTTIYAKWESITVSFSVDKDYKYAFGTYTKGETNEIAPFVISFKNTGNDDIHVDVTVKKTPLFVTDASTFDLAVGESKVVTVTLVESEVEKKDPDKYYDYVYFKATSKTDTSIEQECNFEVNVDIEESEVAPTTYTVTYDTVGGVKGADWKDTKVVDKDATWTITFPPTNVLSIPDDKEFDKVTIDGVDYDIGDTYTFTKDVTIVFVLKDKENPVSTLCSLSVKLGDGLGRISIVDEGETPTFEEPTQHAIINELTIGTKKVIAAKAEEDYRFINWTKSGDDTFSDTNSQITIEITEDVEYLANFELIEYKVTYDANGGTGTMSGETSKYYIFPSCDYTAPTGETFDKWEVNGKTYKVGDTLTLTEDITVKATWKNKSTLSGGGGGSSSSSYKATTKIENGTITPANTSVKKNADQEYTLFDSYDAENGYMLSFAGLEFAGTAKGEHKYQVKYDPRMLTDGSNIYVKLTATPAVPQNRDLEPITATLSVTSKTATLVQGWTGEFYDDMNHNDYDGFNYVITGNGRAELTLKWRTDRLEVNRFFLETYNLTPNTESVDGVEWKSVTISADSDIVNRYDIQLYMTSDDMSNYTDWDLIKEYVVFEK